MSDFRIVIFNNIHDGFTQNDVIKSLIKDVKLNKQQAETFMSRAQTIVAESVSEDLVWKYRKLLYTCGVEFEIQPISSGLVDRKESLESVQVAEELSAADAKRIKNMAKNFVLTDLTYDDVPVYRKRWFVGLALLFFTPLTLFVCITGEIYAQIDGRVYQYSPFFKGVLTFVSCVFLANGFMMATR
ncbi:MAG: hypothetical protein ACI8SR_001200 [Oceanicoccus sp.]